jgi:hypothetical protein
MTVPTTSTERTMAIEATDRFRRGFVLPAPRPGNREPGYRVNSCYGILKNPAGGDL